MKAVNLLPLDARRGGNSGERPLAAYGLLGALAVVLVLVVAYVQAANSVTIRRGELAEVNRQLAAVQRQDAGLAQFAKLAAQRDTRANAIRNVVASRFPWSRTLRALSIALPGDVRLQSLNAKAGEIAGSAPVGGPTLDLTGCGASHRAVARAMVRLRQVTGVTEVALTNSTKAGAPAAGSETSAPADAGTTGCSTTFSMIVTLGGLSAPSGAAPAAAPGTTTPPAAPGTTTPPAAPGTTTATTATSPAPAPSSAPAPVAGSTTSGGQP